MLQTNLLKNYLAVHGGPTLQWISEDTGIQITRVFRLFNGSEMRLSEFLVFQQSMLHKGGGSVRIVDLAMECAEKFSMHCLKDLEEGLERRLGIWRMKNQKSSRDVAEMA